MFFNRQEDFSEINDADIAVSVLRKAGVDVNDENELKFGMIAYGIAMSMPGADGRKSAGFSPPKTGRNDSCLCGSGKKYKKCCLDNEQTAATAQRMELASELNPQLLPRIWSAEGMYEDMQELVRIIDTDEALDEISFSPGKVADFMENIRLTEGLPEQDGDEFDSRLDDLAFRYVASNPGEARIYKNIGKAFKSAAARFPAAGERRALALGVFCGMIAENDDAPEANILNTIMFRRALGEVAHGVVAIEKIIAGLGHKGHDLKKLINNDDPAAWKELAGQIGKAAEALGEEEMDLIREISDRRFDALWDVIDGGEFPVPLPLATQLPLMMRLPDPPEEMNREYAEEVWAMVDAFGEELLDEDHVLYGRMLDRWVKENPGAPVSIIDAVQTLYGLCQLKHLDDYFAKLFFFCGKKGLYRAIGEGEQAYIDVTVKNEDFDPHAADYAAWLSAQGYPALARRLRDAHENKDIAA